MGDGAQDSGDDDASTLELADPPQGPGGDACLVKLHPADADLGLRFPLVLPTYIVGRDGDADFVVYQGAVSRQHARLVADEAKAWWVEDLDSRNGTYINDQRVQRARLTDGDQVRFGDVTYKFLTGGNIEAAYHDVVHAMAVRDGLTGIANKRHFTDFLSREVALAQRHAHALTLVMFDVDHFKQVNDTHGHLAGDAVLRDLAGRIQPRMRREDLFARYGGEEFACVLVSTPLQGGVVFAERVRATVANAACAFDGGQIPFTISVGVTELAPDDTTDELVKRADERLYDAKRGGRNCVVAR